AIDKGSDKLGIPNGYNGELFKEDTPLNDLKIGDEICRKFVDFGKYDFAEDLSVNILGHIFEQSISDIEQLKKVASPEEMDQTISKRKKDAIFYTPDYIVDYIVKNTLGAYLQKEEQKILERNKLKEGINDENYNKRAVVAYSEYRLFLQSIKVLDPACGSGAFLVKVFDYLLAENKRVASIIADLQGVQTTLFESEELIRSLLKNNIYGVDLNQESVEITKLSLWLKTAHKGEKLVTLRDNIKCGNSLIDDEAVAGIKAFSWKKEFEEIMSKGGFDVIVGNPPWGANIDTEAAWLGENYPHSTKQVKDTYKIFIDKGLQLLKDCGFFGFIVPNTFLYQPRYQDVRDIIERYGYGVVNLGEKIFEDVELPSTILVIDKLQKNKSVVIDLRMQKREDLPQLLSALDLQHEIENGSSQDQIHKETGLTFDEVFILKDAGVKHQRTGVGMGEKGKSDIRDRLYYEGTQRNAEDNPLYIGSDVNSYCILNRPTFFLRGNYKQLMNENEIVYFDKKMMEAEMKIVWRQTSEKIRAVILGKEWFANTLQVAVPREQYKESVDLFYALAVFNSNYINYLYVKKVQEDGKVFPQVKLAYIKPLPFVIPDKTIQQRIAGHSQLLIKLYENLYEVVSKFQQVLKVEYGLEKIPRKLEKIWEIEAEECLQVLKLKNIPLEKKQELLEYFTKRKNECSAILTQIKKEQDSLDDEVFDLYKLTPEERATVLQGS
ncbi:MAG: type II restriction enzyme, methylase subunit, partial [Candidatus Peregrinibacteria bacterium Greene0416_62]